MLSVDPIGPTTTSAWIEPHDIYPSVQVSHRFANRRVRRTKVVRRLIKSTAAMHGKRRMGLCPVLACRAPVGRGGRPRSVCGLGFRSGPEGPNNPAQGNTLSVFSSFAEANFTAARRDESVRNRTPQGIKGYQAGTS